MNANAALALYWAAQAYLLAESRKQAAMVEKLIGKCQGCGA